MIGRHFLKSIQLFASYILKKQETNCLLERIKVLFEGNPYVLNDVEKVKEYFEIQSG
ncbi:MAG: hypothetical protein ACI9XJ_001442 [Marivirga sp.]|jgi:hypothetical protein